MGMPGSELGPLLREWRAGREARYIEVRDPTVAGSETFKWQYLLLFALRLRDHFICIYGIHPKEAHLSKHYRAYLATHDSNPKLEEQRAIA